MNRFKIEFQITILALIIAAAVAISGYFAYTNISGIVGSMEKLAQPDHKLYLLKDISSDLVIVENSARMFVLTQNKKALAPFDSLQNRIPEKLQSLYELSERGSEDRTLIDSMHTFSAQKIKIWQEILKLHRALRKNEPDFSEVYSKLEEQKIDTIAVEYEVEIEQKGLFRKLFRKKQTTTETDTTYVEHDVATTNEIKQNISELETKLAQKDKQSNVLESKLIAQNLAVGKKINQLITDAERLANTKWVDKTKEADQLASKTYQLLLILWIAAVVLLLFVLVLLFNFLRKTRTYQNVLRKAKTEAENLAKVKEQFAANVSHELRTPVNAIYGLSEQLMLQELDPTAREQVSILAKSANHLKSIVNDTLDFSKIQANKLKFSSDHFSPAEIFNEVLSLQKFEASKKGIVLKFDNRLPLNFALLGDPLRLKQILINIIGNAIKFTNKGTISVQTQIEDMDSGSLLHFVITDSGIGISDENLSVIFEEFVQADNHEGKKYSGTGLGLAIVKKLVELQKGTITVESKLHQGTSISVKIPYLRGDIEKIERDDYVPLIIPNEMQELSVLIADDEEFNRYLLQAILKKWKMKFNEATNGLEAVELSKKTHFDVILMDVRMPRLNGIEATKAILQENPDATIYAITASNKDIDRQECLYAGMKGFLSKPFSEKNLFETFLGVLQSKSEINQSDQSDQLNLKQLEHLFAGDLVFMNEMITLFIKSTEKGLLEIKKAEAADDWESVHETAHKMASPCKHLQFENLYSNIKKIEELTQQTGKKTELAQLLAIVETDISTINARLKKHLQKLS